MWPRPFLASLGVSFLLITTKAGEIHERTFNLPGNRYVKVSHEFDYSADVVSFTIEGDTTGYISLGFAHDKKHDDDNEYDTVVVGVKDGEGYVGSYAQTNWHDLDRQSEVRYKYVDGSESNGVTTVTVERTITTCYDESFDWRQVGDVVLAYVSLNEEDVSEVSPYMPEYIDLRLHQIEEKKGHMTLFTHSMTFVDHLDSLLPTTDNQRKREVLQGGVDAEDSSSLTTCTVHKLGDDFDFYIGYRPDFEVGIT